MNNVTFSDMQDSIVACRDHQVISATDECGFYAFLFIFHVLLCGIS